MVFEKLKKRIEQNKAKRLGMTVEEMRSYKKQLKTKEATEKLKFEKWQIEQKYKKKRKQTKKGKGGVTGLLEGLSGSGDMFGGDDPLGIFGSPKKSRKKWRKK